MEAVAIVVALVLVFTVSEILLERRMRRLRDRVEDLEAKTYFYGDDDD